MVYKSPVNLITNPNPVSSHQTLDSMNMCLAPCFIFETTQNIAVKFCMKQFTVKIQIL
jgi:hypothetical protein